MDKRKQQEDAFKTHKGQALRRYHKALVKLHILVGEWDKASMASQNHDQEREASRLLAYVGMQCGTCDREKAEYERLSSMTLEEWAEEEQRMMEFLKEM